VPSEPAKQAEAIGSIASEAALLAHDVGDGSTTRTFAQEHAKALQRNLEKLQPAVEDPALVRQGMQVADALELLVDASAEEPGRLDGA
jgi:hypothetical protein